LVAIVLAFWMHVDAFELFTTFMRDPATRNAMIDKQAEYSKKFEGALRPPGTTAPANPPRQTTVIEATLQLAPQGATASPPVNPGQQVPPQVRELQDQYARAITELKDAQTQLVTLGVPIGWTQERRQAANMVSIFWTCRIDDPRSTERSWFGSCDAGRMNVWFGLPTNPGVILSLIVGGLLIGLGGPFWHDAVRSLTNIRSLARSAGADSGTAAAAAIAGGVGQPKTPVDVFKIANSARAVASPGSGSRARPLLNPDGTDG
jgi:hypothetical protein